MVEKLPISSYGVPVDTHVYSNQPVHEHEVSLNSSTESDQNYMFENLIKPPLLCQSIWQMF